MNPLEQEFLEEYAHAESLCCEGFSCEFGIAEYCAQMEPRLKADVEFRTRWNETFRRLCRLNWLWEQVTVRGKHNILTPWDVREIRSFREMLEDGDDPLALKETPAYAYAVTEDRGRVNPGYFRNSRAFGTAELSRFLKIAMEVLAFFLVLHQLFK